MSTPKSRYLELPEEIRTELETGWEDFEGKVEAMAIKGYDPLLLSTIYKMGQRVAYLAAKVEELRYQDEAPDEQGPD